jgi:uncharacterized protein YdhG (YjbR/CyaY superfamily)
MDFDIKETPKGGTDFIPELALVRMNSSKVAEDVDAYINNAPEAAREKLSRLRSIFRDVAPEAEEVISYHMPYYKYHGWLGGFAAYKDHVSLFGAFPDEMREELKPYKIGRGSVQFPLDKPLPVGLVTKLVTAHLRMNETGPSLLQ